MSKWWWWGGVGITGGRIVCWILVAQSCLTLLQPMDYSPPGSSVHGKERILEWVAIPSLGDLPNPGIKPESPALQAGSLPLSHWRSPLCWILTDSLGQSAHFQGFLEYLCVVETMNKAC